MKIKLKDVEKFKRLLLLNGLSQREYGKKIDISAPYANQVANGTRNPGPEIAKKTADLLQVGFEDIFFIEGACKSNHSDKVVI